MNRFINYMHDSKAYGVILLIGKNPYVITVWIKARGCKIGIGHSWIMRGLKLRRGFPLNGRKMNKVTWTRTSDGMHSDHSDALRYSNSFLSLMCIASTAALAPLGRPLRIHQFELVAGQKLVREVVCRIAREKDIGIREVSVERLCHAASNRRLFGRVVARQDAQQIIEEFTADEVVVNEAVVLLAGIQSIGPETRIQNLQTCLLPCLGIAPDVEVAMNASTGSEVRIYLKKKVLRMGFEKDASSTDNLRPAVKNGDHDLADHE